MAGLRLRHCHKASLLLVRAEHDRLALGERLSLALHVRLCGNCRRFGQQMRFFTDAMARWPEAEQDSTRR